MLITITIIVVLVAILLPSLSRSRETARRAVCLSNVRQLNYSFIEYANDYSGKTLAANTSVTGGNFWAKSLVSYSTAKNTAAAQKILLNTICPSAPTPGKSAGTATASWGPYTTAIDPYSPLKVGTQTGSYGLNGNLYSNNPPPPDVWTLTGPVGVIASAINTSGNHSVYGDVIVTPGNVRVWGTAFITGRLTVTPSATVTDVTNIGSITRASPLQVPDVVGIFNQLATTPGKLTIASVPNNATVNFNTYPVVHVTGDADFSRVATVTGAGTVLVSGNVTKLPSSPLTFNIVCLGTVNLKNGSLTGSIYAVGDCGGNGNGVIHGVLVTLGTYYGNGGPDIRPTNFPSFDRTYYRPGISTSINTGVENAANVPSFGDCVMPEAWPAIGDPLPTAADQAKGLGRWQDSNLGRFYIRRHSGAVNIGFLDGHAETVQLQKLPTLKWSPQF